MHDNAVSTWSLKLSYSDSFSRPSPQWSNLSLRFLEVLELLVSCGSAADIARQTLRLPSRAFHSEWIFLNVYFVCICCAGHFLWKIKVLFVIKVGCCNWQESQWNLRWRVHTHRPLAQPKPKPNPILFCSACIRTFSQIRWQSYFWPVQTLCHGSTTLVKIHPGKGQYWPLVGLWVLHVDHLLCLKNAGRKK